MNDQVSEGLAQAIVIARDLVSSHGSGAPDELAGAVYARCHCRPEEEVALRDDVEAMLMRACDTQPCIDFGWTVQDVAASQQRLLSKGDASFLVSPGAFVDDLGPGASSQRGMGAGLFAPAGTASLQQGYYYAFGQLREGLPQEYPRVRFYWNVSEACCADVVRALTRRLNRAGLPFRLKCGTVASTLARADSLVLFVARRHAWVASTVVKAVHEEHGDALSDLTPLFAKRLGRGLAVADDVDGDTSFGMARSILLARAMVDGAGKHANTAEEMVAGFFRDHGVDPLRPHLRRPDVADYHLPSPGRVSHDTPTRASSSSLGTEVDYIAGRLCREAIFSGERCTWMTPVLGSGGVSRAAGASLYDGTAGIALFLAAAYRLSAEPVFAEVARAAAAQTVATIGREPVAVDWGRHGGRGGVAWALASVGQLLADEQWVDASRSMAARLAALEPEAAPLDIVGGLAGTVSTLAELASTLDDDGLMDAAERLGATLAARACRQDDRYSWRTLPQLGDNQVDLLGAAHGTSGIATSMLRVAAVRDAKELLAAARGALAYERFWANRCDGLWPDLRGIHGAEPGARLGCGGTWCHGSAGAGLARLSAYAVAHKAGLDEAAELLAGAKRAAAHALASLELGPDTSPCHGLAGAGELLIELSQATGEPKHLEQARDLARRRVQNQGGRYDRWGCGVPDAGSAPGLMIGRAGIGLFLVRCLDASLVPCALMM